MERDRSSLLRVGFRLLRDRDWLASRLDAGLTLTAIGKEAGTSRQTVAAWVTRHGLTTTSRAKRRPAPAKLRALYRRHGTAEGVAAQVGVAVSTAHRWLLDAGVDVTGAGRPRVDLDMEWLQRRRAEGATIAQLAAETGVGRETIRRRLNDS